MVLVNLQKDHLYSYLKGVTFILSRNWEMNYKHVYVLGLITFGLQTFYKCTLKYFFPNRKYSSKLDCSHHGIRREYEHICKAGWKAAKGDRET